MTTVNMLQLVRVLRCKCSDGTSGIVIALAASALLGGCATSRPAEPPDANPVGVPTTSSIEDGDDKPASSSGAPVDAGIPTSAGGSVDAKYKPLAQAVRSGQGKAIADETSKLLSANGNDPVALNTLALYQLRKGHTGAAKLLLNRAFEKNPPTAALHNNLGVALLDEGDQIGAIVNFKKALKLDDGHPEAQGNLGSLYVQGGDYAKALPLLNGAYRSLGGNPMVANNYAIALRASKDFGNAARVYQEILKRNSRDLAATLNYAILLIDFMGKPKEGLDLVYKVKFIESERKDVLDRANALEKKAKSELNL